MGREYNADCGPLQVTVWHCSFIGFCQIFTLLQPMDKREKAAVHDAGTNNEGLSFPLILW